jgi:hypothetical protein
MSWDKTRAEYARKARSMPTGQTHVSVLAKDLERLVEEGENCRLAQSALQKLVAAHEALRADLERFARDWQGVRPEERGDEYEACVREGRADCARAILERLRTRP